MHSICRISRHCVAGLQLGNEDPASEGTENLAGLLSSHCAGSGILWKGPRSHISAATELYLQHGVINHPFVDLEKEKNKELKRLHEFLVGREAQGIVLRPSAMWDLDNLLLTGATGFVGIHLLEQLLTMLPNTHVTCLVRGRDADYCLQRLHTVSRTFEIEDDIDWRRVVAVAGDIGKPQLGMSNKEFAELSNSISTTLHLAAKDNFFMPYNVMYNSVINGFFHVLDFCTQVRVKPLLLVGSILAKLVGHQAEDNVGLHCGYAQTKYVLTELACQLAQVNCSPSGQPLAFSCAPPVILIDLGYAHKFTSPPMVPDITDSWETVMKVCLLRNVVPDQEGNIDFVSVSYVVKCMIELLEAHRDGHLGGFEDNYRFDLYSFNQLNLSNLWDAICEFRKPVPVKRVPFSEYWKIFREVLLESGGTAANYLRTSVSPKFPEQCRKAFALRSYQYHSIKQGEHPSPSMHYLHDLLRVIDEKMVLSDP